MAQISWGADNLQRTKQRAAVRGHVRPTLLTSPPLSAHLVMQMVYLHVALVVGYFFILTRIQRVVICKSSPPRIIMW